VKSPIANISTPRWRDWPSGEEGHNDSGLAEPRSLILRVRVAASRDRLTRELAEGADPGSSPELAFRAAQLTSNRRRRRLVGTLRRTINEAGRPSLGRSRMVIINRGAVLEAEDAINAMIARLSYAHPVCAKGMAMAEQMLTNAERSPLYNLAEPGALRHAVLAATEALDPTPGALVDSRSPPKPGSTESLGRGLEIAR
jgi:hypothetical protein